MGNLRSLENAFRVVGADPTIIQDPTNLTEYSGISLPGVGGFKEGMDHLRDRGFVEPLRAAVIDRDVPYLGICLGMQFLAEESEEQGRHRGLGWLPGTVRRVTPSYPSYSVPHIGWNTAKPRGGDDPLFAELGQAPVFYFVHSYHLVVENGGNEVVTSTAYHGTEITASVSSGNIMGVQFHPEKSQGVGLKLLENFVRFVTETVDG